VGTLRVEVLRLLLGLDGARQTCPHGGDNVFPGFTEMLAYTCTTCGQGCAGAAARELNRLLSYAPAEVAAASLRRCFSHDHGLLPQRQEPYNLLWA
jgi:hypothetical protein